MKVKPSRQVLRARRRAGLPVAADHQRGAAAIFGAVALAAAAIAMLFGINIGMLYFAQRDLQRQAVLGAMAGVQVASGCRASGSLGGVPGTVAQVTARVKEALNNNAGGSSGSGFLTGIAGQPAVQIGKTDHSSASSFTFVPLSEGDPNVDAVRVNLSRSAPTPLGTMFSSTPVTLYASATAWQPAYGSFFLGTGLANLDTASGTLLGPLLNGLLGTNVNLAALNSAGLAQTQVNLGRLMVAAGVTNLNDLLSLQTNLTGALNILGQAVSGTGGGLISGLSGQVYSNSGGPTQAYFGDLFTNAGGAFNPLVGDVASAVPFIGAMDLLTALGEDAAANTSPIKPIALQPGSGYLNLLSLPPPLNVATVQTFVTIIEPPQFAVGPALPSTMARSAQV
ncbi:MAG: hypothetical protein ACHQIO_16785, partial [Nevskiales bacterium]